MSAEQKILLKGESYKIIGVCMKVHRTLGTGFLETIYEEAMEREFVKQKVPFKRQVKLPVFCFKEKKNRTSFVKLISFAMTRLFLKLNR